MGEKKPPEATLPGSTKVQFLVVCFGARTCQNVVLGLIRPLTAPIGVIIGASGAESRRGADYGVGLAPWAPKWAEQNWDPGRPGPDFSNFSRNGPKWLGKALGLLFGGLGEGGYGLLGPGPREGTAY